MRGLSDRGRILFLLAIMVVVAVITAAMSIWLLYRTALDEGRSRLVETAQSQARLIEAVARFDAVYSRSAYPGGAGAATLSQITDAHEKYKGFGETGEFTLARREEDNIVFLLSHRHYDLDTPKPVPWESSRAEPMRRALSGGSGTVIGPDYRDVLVLAAYEPVAELDLGIVAKIDMAEVRRPFLRAAGLSGLGVLLIVVLGAVASRRIGRPMVERLKAEEALRESEARLSRATEMAKIGYWLWDEIEDKAIYCSEEMAKMYGVASGEGLAASLSSHAEDRKWVHPEDREYFDQAVKSSITTGDGYDIEYRIINSAGEIRHVHVIELSFTDQDGKITRSSGIVHDITHQKRVEAEVRELNERLERRVEERTEELRESEQRFSDFSGATSDWYWEADENLRFTYFSDRFSDIAGIPKEALLGKTRAETPIPDTDPEAWETLLADFAAHRSFRDFLITRTRPDGSLVHMSTNGKAIYDDAGNFLGYRGAGRDITELKRLESELLRQGRLATLGQLTATVSHELRNPLGVIRTSAFIVRDNLKHDDPLVRRSLERIERNIIRCDRIIDELLDFTRITEIEAEPTAIDAWLEETLNEQTLPAGVALRLELAMPGVAVPFDRDRFRRAIINVFDNGCQAMTGEGFEDSGAEAHALTVRTRQHDGRVEVIFEDTGPGIAPDVYERIFEPLYSTKGFGVGLGLPVVKQIMEQHSGGIEIETAEGRGARVCLWLPTGCSIH